MKPYEFTKPKPVPAANEVLVKVEASTINPRDNLFISGRYFKQLIPTNAGFEGCGRVEAVGCEALNDLIEKCVSFQTSAGSWAEYSTTSTYFLIDEDAVASAASGIINPLAALGFVQTYRKNKHAGIIHTPVASALGRQLVRLCRTENIMLFKIVSS